MNVNMKRPSVVASVEPPFSGARAAFNDPYFCKRVP